MVDREGRELVRMGNRPEGVAELEAHARHSQRRAKTPTAFDGDEDEVTSFRVMQVCAQTQNTARTRAFTRHLGSKVRLFLCAAPCQGRHGS